LGWTGEDGGCFEELRREGQEEECVERLDKEEGDVG
jgi:hypothetical protein